MPTSLALAILRSPFRGRFPARPSGPCSPRVRSQQAARGSSPGDGTRSAVLGQAPHVPLVNGVLDPPFRRDVELGWVRCQVDKHPIHRVVGVRLPLSAARLAERAGAPFAALGPRARGFAGVTRPVQATAARRSLVRVMKAGGPLEGLNPGFPSVPNWAMAVAAASRSGGGCRGAATWRDVLELVAVCDLCAGNVTALDESHFSQHGVAARHDREPDADRLAGLQLVDFVPSMKVQRHQPAWVRSCPSFPSCLSVAWPTQSLMPWGLVRWQSKVSSS